METNKYDKGKTLLVDRQASFVVKMTTGLSLGRLVGIFKAEKPDRNGHLGGGGGDSKCVGTLMILFCLRNYK